MKRFVLFFQNRCQGLCTLFLTLVGIFSLAIFLFPEMATAVTDKDVVAPNLTADVGDSDPMGAPGSMVFRDDELYIGHIIHTPNAIGRGYSYPVLDDLAYEESWCTPYMSDWNNDEYYHTGDSGDDVDPWFSRNVAAAAGRFSDPARDHAVVCWFRGDGQVKVVQIDLAQSTQSPIDPSMQTLIPGSTAYGAGLDVAAGDLDLLADELGYLHDEIVIVRTPAIASYGSGYEVLIDVLDGNLQKLASQVISTGAACSTIVSTALGDFDGDHLTYEIAVGWTARNGSQYDMSVSVFRLVTDPTSGNRSLALVSTAEKITSDYQTVELAAGAFVLNGKGKEQVVAVVGPASGSGIPSFETYLYELDSSSTLQMKKTETIPTKNPIREVRAMAGLLKYDPALGYDVNRRQLAIVNLADAGSVTTIESRGFEFDETYTIAEIPEIEGEQHVDGGDDQEANRLNIAVGNFVGHGIDGTSESPVEQIMATIKIDYTTSAFLSSNVGNYLMPGRGWGSIYGLFKSEDLDNQHQNFDPFILAYDYDGDSWKLGAPTHMVMEQNNTLHSVVQEPPKHVDYLPVNPGELEGEWDVQTVGAYIGFKVCTKDQEGKELSSSTKNTSSYDIGTSAELDVTACVAQKLKAGCKKANTSVEADVKFGYAYESTDTTVNSQYAEANVHYDDSSGLDDTIMGNLSTLNIYRYPILAYDTGDPDQAYGYYEVIVPSTSQVQYSGGGLHHSDFYQPIQENHNLLSYPVFGSNGVTWIPEDLGSISYTDPETNQTITVDRIWNWTSNESPTIKYWEANEYSWGLDFTVNSGTDTEKEHSNTLTEGLDLKVGTSFKIWKVGFDIAATVNFDGNQSWGGATTATTKDSMAKGLELIKPEGEHTDRAYAYTTAVYAAQDGSFKVAHAVDPFGSTAGEYWWKRQYSAAPDPALSLLWRFEWHEPHEGERYDWWTLRDVDDPVRKRMRGFFMREAEVDPVSGEHNLLGSPPLDGDVVLLCARIYNFSFVDIPEPGFPVTFYYYLWDNDIDEPVGELMTQPAMSTRVNKLDKVTTPDGTSMVEVRVPWNTTGLNKSEGKYLYRFLVRVDEPTTEDLQGEVRELHEGWDDSGDVPHGNNEGFYPWRNGLSVLPNTSMDVSAAGIQLPFATSRVRVTLASKAEDYYFPKHAFSIKIKGKLKKGKVKLVVGQRYDVRLHIVSGSAHSNHYMVGFFNGHPNEGAKAFKTGMVRGLAQGDNYFWGEWTPKSTGDYDIHAHIFGKVSAKHRQEKWATLHATVVEDKHGRSGK